LAGKLALFEEMLERKKDIEYWKPLRKELEALRHKQELPY